MKTRVVIIGAGALGRAFEHILKKKDVEIDLWDKDSTKVAEQKDLAEIVPLAEVVFLAVPSWFFSDALEEIQPFLRPETLLVGLSKGLQPSGLRTDEVLKNSFPQNASVLLLGPMLAKEIQEDQPAYGIVAGDEVAVQTVITLFEKTNLHLQGSPDVLSHALLSVLKNIYSLVLGMADGLGYKQNVKGQLVVQSLKEMKEILERTGGSPETALGTTGAADFIATGFSPSSQNRRLGEEIVRGEISSQSEGWVSIRSLVSILKENLEGLPLLKIVANMADHPEQAQEIAKELPKSL